MTISGKRLENEPIFMLRDVTTDGIVNNVSFCSVEEMALDYYKQQGYNEGIHGESLTFSTIFTLLMWDVIFYNIGQDVFRTLFQVIVPTLLLIQVQEVHHCTIRGSIRNSF